MSYCRVSLRNAASAVVLLTVLSAGQVFGEPVTLERKYVPGRTTYIEVNRDITQKTSGPRGEQEYTIRELRAVWERAASPSDGKTQVTLTFDRALQMWDIPSMGLFQFDTDDPENEDAALQFGSLVTPMLGMSMVLEMDQDGKVVGLSGMNAIKEKIAEGAVGNAFWGQLQRDLTDEKARENWGRDPLLIYPSRKVDVGDTWEASSSSENPRVGTIVSDFRYEVLRIGKEKGREVVVISISAKMSLADDPKAAEGPKTELTGTATGEAIYDVALGTIIKQVEERNVAIKMLLPTPEGEEKPQFMQIEATVKTTTTVMTEKERLAQKLEARKFAATRKKAAEEAVANDVAVVDDALASAEADVDWMQWGGPRRDFKIATTGLVEKWPEGGPKKLWSRDLGDGYAAIACDGRTLYTLYWIPDEVAPDAGKAGEAGGNKNTAKSDASAQGDKEKAGGDADKDGADADDDDDEDNPRRNGHEVVVALEANTGKTLWEYKYPVAWEEKMSLEYGPGPNSTPLIIGDRVYAIGAMVRLVCLDKKTGKRIWEHDLRDKYDASSMTYGYGVSPLAYKKLIIISIGGEGHSVAAFKQDDGSLVWQKQDFGPAYGSPQIINVDGEEQLLVVRGKGVAGLDPMTGELKWNHDHGDDANISTPIWCEDNIVFISAAYGVGARGIKLTRKDDKTTAEELWYNPKMRIHHGNAIRLGEVIIGSTGDFGPAFVAAVDVKTGKFLWKKRGYSKANFVYADGRLIILDEDGHLALATPGKKSLKTHCKVELCKRNAWTAPTLVGTRLYVRDRKQIMAVDLSKAANKS